MSTSIMRTIARALGIGVLVAGCTPVSLIQMDNEWTRTHQAQLQAEARPEYLATDFEAQLAAISDRAAAAGDHASKDDAANAIGFYRVAALSAWKSGLQREDQVVQLSDKGGKTCASLPKGPAGQPRDCALLEIVPYLALFDHDARAMLAITKEADQTPERKIPANRLAELATEIDAAVAATIKIGKARTELKSLPLPDSFFDYLETTTERMYCGTGGFIGRALDADTQRFQSALTQLKTVKRGNGSIFVCP